MRTSVGVFCWLALGFFLWSPGFSGEAPEDFTLWRQVRVQAPAGWSLSESEWRLAQLQGPLGTVLLAFEPTPLDKAPDALFEALVDRVIGQRIHYEVEQKGTASLAGFTAQTATIVVREPAPDYTRLRLTVANLGRRTLVLACLAPVLSWQLAEPDFRALEASLSLVSDPGELWPVPLRARPDLDFSAWKHPSLPNGLALSLPAGAPTQVLGGAVFCSLTESDARLLLLSGFTSTPLRVQDIFGFLQKRLGEALPGATRFRIAQLDPLGLSAVVKCVWQAPGKPPRRFAGLLSLQGTSLLLTGLEAAPRGYLPALRSAAKALGRIDLPLEQPLVQFAVPEEPFAASPLLLPLSQSAAGSRLMEWQLPASAAGEWASLDRALEAGQLDPWDDFQLELLLW